MKQLNAAAPDKPFFLYYVPGGSHSPHQPTQEWIDKFKGKFDMGWNAMRDQIFANQKRLGVIPANAQLTPWPDDLPKWETLSADEKKLFARQAEVYAGYTAYTDHEIGRVIQAGRGHGQARQHADHLHQRRQRHQPEGTLLGTPNQYTAYNGILDFPVAEQLKFYDAWGSAATYPHMAVAWSWAFDTPFKWTKQVASHFGGTRQGMAISWPGPHQGRRRHPHPVPPHHRHRADDPRSHGHQGAGDGQRHQAKADRRREHGLHLRQGERQRAVDAQDPVFRDDRQSRDLSRWLVRQHDAAARAVDLERAVAAHRRYKWELYNLTEDYSQANDLAAKMPDKLKEMQALFVQEAAKYNVLPLDNSIVCAGDRAAAERHGGTDRLHLLGRDARHSNRQRAEHPEQVVHDHRRGRGAAGRRRRDDRHRGRALGRLWALPAQGQAGVRLQHARSSPSTAGKDRMRSPRASTRSCSTTPMTAPASRRAAPAC